MTLEAVREFHRRRIVRELWQPLPGPQTDAYRSPADELFYGGSAGGGKSDLMLGLALTQHRKSIIFRREYPQLKDIVERSRALLPPETGAYFNGQGNTWRNIPGNRTLEFGAVQYEDDKQKYKGRAHDLKCFDEVGDYTESQYRFLIGWARTTIPGQRVRIVCAGNPPSVASGMWVTQRWGAWLDSKHPHPARPGELRWYAMVAGEEVEREDGHPFEYKGEAIQPKSRTFIPARLTDNPYLMATDYGATLQALPEPLRSQLLYGDFTAGLDDDPWQVIPTAWVRAAQERWRQLPKPDVPLTTVGVDVARGGKDKTVIAKRYGTWFAPLIKHAGQSTPDGPTVAGLVMSAIAGEGSPAVNVDVIGVGSSVYDFLRDKARAVGVNNAEKSGALDRSGRLGFVNLRAEMYWRLREALDPVTGENLALPDDSELLADLCAAKWEMRVGGIKVESKEDIIKRLGRSPDCGDALALAHFLTVRGVLFGAA